MLLLKLTYLFTAKILKSLWDLSMEKGYISEEEIVTLEIASSDKSKLNMPQLSSSEIDRLSKTFSCYCKFLEDRWD